VKDLLSAGAPTAAFRAALDEVFGHFDADRDGLLNETELHALQRVCQGEPMSVELLAFIRRSCACDDSGRHVIKPLSLAVADGVVAA
jgi:hypothetical protein